MDHPRSKRAARAGDGSLSETIRRAIVAKQVKYQREVHNITSSPIVKKKALALEKKHDNCRKCPAHKTACQKVYWRGTAFCQVLFVGEAPGRDEDTTGYPFVGRAGKDVFDPLIEDVRRRLKGKKKKFTFGIVNVIACLPLDEDAKGGRLPPLRKPTPEEAEACSQRLLDTLEILNPQAVVYMGEVAKKLGRPIIEGWNEDLPSLDIYHPAYFLRVGRDPGLIYKKMLVPLVDFIKEVRLR